MKAIAPNEFPPLPDSATAWARSLRRGSVYHAHALGFPVCNSKLYLDRNRSEAPRNVADMQYWGVCSRCYRLAMKETTA